MNTNKVMLAGLAALGISSISATAGAQVVSAKEFGTGVAAVAGLPSENLNYAIVRLNSDHTFVVQLFFKSEGSEKGFSGKWAVAGPHNYALTVGGFDGKKATGSGTLRTTPDEQDFSKLNLTGTASTGAFNVGFNSSVAQGLTAKFKMDQVEHGTGSLNIGSKQYDVRTVWLQIVPEGNFALRLMGDQKFEVRGHWQLDAARNDRIHLTFMKDQSGNPVTGDGSVTLKSNRREYDTVQINGSAAGQTFAGHFNAMEIAVGAVTPANVKFHSMGPVDKTAELDSTQLASGTYQFGNENATVTEARVILRSNGQALIGLIGSTERLLKGTWTNKSANEIQVNITGGYENATGTGNVVLDSTRKKFTLINLNGSVAALSFSVAVQGN